MTHTKGPWWDESGVIHAKARSWTEDKHACVHVAAVRDLDGEDAEDTEGNAALIAAAPDLLEALEDAVCLVESLRVEDADPEAMRSTLAEWKAAISKAKGKP